jgi:N-acetylglucosaminyldiphosphoundecaprenol N-acetyl-beta-D-mannosaminyltransferase
VGIGVSIEFVAGMVKRAPVWMQRSGLEWFYRLAAEPRRLWKRYAVTNPRFVQLVLQQYRRGRR